jgi:hypothetical protein
MARIRPIEKLTFGEMLKDLHLYAGVPDGLIQLPIPETIMIGSQRYIVPFTMDEMADAICYGQRLYLSRKEANDVAFINRAILGYFYPFITNSQWDEEKVVEYERKILTCKVIELYPVTIHLNKLMGDLAKREVGLLHREPSKVELAAGIEKLDIFAEMMSLDFLRDTMKVSVPEVLLTPYNECLVRFMIHKELADYNDRYFKISKEKAEAEYKQKSRFGKK